MAIVLTLGKERKGPNERLARVLPLGKERKRPKRKVGDIPALRRKERKMIKQIIGYSPALYIKGQKTIGDSPARREIDGDNPALREREEKDQTNNWRYSPVIGKAMKMSKHKISDGPILREREEHGQTKHRCNNVKGERKRTKLKNTRALALV